MATQLKRAILITTLLCPLLVQCDTSSALGLLPSVEAASRTPNAFRIFNAVHSAMRQWGSSIQHNGMSFLPVTVPEGNLFYHGRHDPEIPGTLEWLAFEMEHADMFGQNWEFDDLDGDMTASSLHGKVSSLLEQSGESPGGLRAAAAGALEARKGLSRGGTDRQHTFVGPADDPDNTPPRLRPHLPPEARGYLQTYRATRPLNLLYVDGQAAAKCPLGTLDSQEYILRARDPDNDDNDHNPPGLDEWDRAKALCKFASELGIDGIIRMEAGFEIIYCDFTPGGGLELVSVHGRPWRNETHNSANEKEGGEWNVLGGYEWFRAAAERYHGFPVGRAEVDFGGMVSAFAYEVNTTNPDASRAELPRLVNATAEARMGIRNRLREVFLSGKGGGSRVSSEVGVNWQGVVDSIVTRFATRLLYMSSPRISARHLRSELATLLYPFLDFPTDVSLEDTTEPQARCTEHYLASIAQSNASWIPEEQAIFAAVHTVSRTICSSLFAMRREAHSSDNGTETGEDEAAAAHRVRSLALDLRGKLDWPVWRECGRCEDPGQMCFVAMFPKGDEGDHFSPRCKRAGEIGFGYFFDPHWRYRAGRVELDSA